MMQRLTPQKIALALFGLALFRSLVIALVIQPSYGADGAGYLRYIDTLLDPSDRASLWYIRGTTPVYPLFAYMTYLLGSGYTIVLIQIILSGLIAPSIYVTLRSVDERAALLSGILIAIDPQTGLLFQHVATEALYITLLGLGMAAFFWNVQRGKSPLVALGLGILLGVGSLTRPVGLLLIVPYAFFYILMTRSILRTALMSAGYISIVILLSLLNLWRFDFFATSSTSGLYLGTRVFSTGGLYSPDQGNYSETLYYLAREPIPLCGIHLTDSADPNLKLPQQLRLCLYYGHGLTLDEISTLYSHVYGESIRSHPNKYIASTFSQIAEYVWKTSDPYSLSSAQAQVVRCNIKNGEWYDDQNMFCPATPTPLAALGEVTFAGMFLFNIFTHGFIFILAGILFWRSIPMVRWIFLFCLGIYSYHAFVTANAGTILPRYLTVTNIYKMVTFAFVAVGMYDWYWHSLARSVKSKHIEH